MTQQREPVTEIPNGRRDAAPQQEPPVDGEAMSTAEAQHFGRDDWMGNGEVCHDGMGEGFCHPNCNRCPQPCPIEPCPLADEYGDRG